MLSRWQKKMNPDEIQHTVDIVNSGGVIAYPTEAVYGIGCDPFNESAVKRVLKLKNRPMKKGFILIASRWSQVSHLIKPIGENLMQPIFASWPGPVTWVFPVAATVPKWITGQYDSIGIRITSHQVAKTLCDHLDAPLISSSANLGGQPPIRCIRELKKLFGDAIDVYVSGELGGRKNPSEIRDALSGKQLRA